MPKITVRDSANDFHIFKGPEVRIYRNGPVTEIFEYREAADCTVSRIILGIFTNPVFVKPDYNDDATERQERWEQMRQRVEEGQVRLPDNDELRGDFAMNQDTDPFTQAAMQDMPKHMTATEVIDRQNLYGGPAPSGEMTHDIFAGMNAAQRLEARWKAEAVDTMDGEEQRKWIAALPDDEKAAMIEKAEEEKKRRRNEKRRQKRAEDKAKKEQGQDTEKKDDSKAGSSNTSPMVEPKPNEDSQHEETGPQLLDKLKESGAVQCGVDMANGEDQTEITDFGPVVEESAPVSQEAIDATLAAAEARHSERQKKPPCETCGDTGTVRDPESDDPLATVICPDC